MFARNYYYLVTSLPDLVFEHPRSPVSAAAFMDDLAEFLDPEDAALLRIVRLPADNANFITLLESRDRELQPGGNYTRDELLEEIKQPDALPDYLQILARAYREGRQLFPGMILEDQLNLLFYEQVIAHPNAFIAAWFTFELNLRNVLVALTLRKKLPHLQGQHTASVLCCNEIAEHILKSTAPDFGLCDALPWIDYVVEIQEEEIPEREQELDRLRWNMLDELTIASYFRIETLLAFCIKLMIVERWMRLDSAVGRQKLARMVEEIIRRVEY